MGKKNNKTAASLTIQDVAVVSFKTLRQHNAAYTYFIRGCKQKKNGK